MPPAASVLELRELNYSLTGSATRKAELRSPKDDLVMSIALTSLSLSSSYAFIVRRRSRRPRSLRGADNFQQLIRSGIGR